MTGPRRSTSRFQSRRLSQPEDVTKAPPHQLRLRPNPIRASDSLANSSSARAQLSPISGPSASAPVQRLDRAWRRRGTSLSNRVRPAYTITSINAAYIVAGRTTYAAAKDFPALAVLGDWDAKRGIPAAAVIASPHVVHNPQHAARAFYETLAHPVAGPQPYPRLPMRFANGPLRHVQSPPPLLGEHNDAVLRGELGVSADELALLRHDRITGEAPQGF